MSAKPTLILIHGFRGTHHGLQLIPDSLTGVNAVIPDLPGFGKGPVLDHYDLASYVEWLHTFVTQHAPATEKPFLLGHSFGSIVCAAYTAKYPSTIQKLILVNPIGAPALEGPQKVLTKLTQAYYYVGKKLPTQAAKKWLSSKIVVAVMSEVMAKSKDKTMRRYIHEQHNKYFSSFHDASSVSESFNTSIHHNVRESAPQIKVPTLIIAGERDDITPVSKQRELQALFPKNTPVELTVIKNVGHLTHYETPAEVAANVQAFIKSV